MSINKSADHHSGPALLEELIRNELLSIPIAQWGFFFPCHVAVWRYIETEKPGVLGELQAGYDTEPYFRGKGSKWFCEMLGDKDEYIFLIEAIMYTMVTSLNIQSKERGFLLESEVHPLDASIVKRLASVVLLEINAAIASGELK